MSRATALEPFSYRSIKCICMNATLGSDFCSFGIILLRFFTNVNVEAVSKSQIDSVG